MRKEIKFRVFCETHKRWEYYTLGDLVCGATSSESGEGLFKGETWGEYIGKRDKNGTDIYEGDILRRDGYAFGVKYGDKTIPNVIGEGMFLIEQVRWVVVELKTTKDYIGFSMPTETNYAESTYPATYEIVGNIFESEALIPYV